MGPLSNITVCFLPIFDINLIFTFFMLNLIIKYICFLFSYHIFTLFLWLSILFFLFFLSFPFSLYLSHSSTIHQDTAFMLHWYACVFARVHPLSTPSWRGTSFLMCCVVYRGAHAHTVAFCGSMVCVVCALLLYRFTQERVLSLHSLPRHKGDSSHNTAHTSHYALSILIII